LEGGELPVFHSRRKGELLVVHFRRKGELLVSLLP